MNKTLLTTLMALLQLALLAQNPQRYTSFSEALIEPEKVLWLDLRCNEMSDFERQIQKLPKVAMIFPKRSKKESKRLCPIPMWFSKCR